MTPRSAVVIGGGIVGLSVARELLLRRPGLAVVLLEKEPAVALHQTGHNSGVVHSGVYYAPGSLRARTCTLGARLLQDWCSEQGVTVLRRGKLIVATRPRELPGLDELHRRAGANGVAGVAMLGPGGMREVEPHVAGLRALHVPGSAVVDYGEVARALAAEVSALGGEVRCSTRARRLVPDGAGARVDTDTGPVRADLAVACAGLQADRLARASGLEAAPRIVPFRGDFWLLRPERAGLVRGLIYPVPDPSLPFLGTHATRRVDGAVWVGPNAVPALAREGYRRGAVDLHDLGDIAADPGLWRLMARHWRAGVGEIARDRSRRLLARSLRRYLPEVSAADLEPGPCGIRAQALSPGGRLLDDFVVSRAGAAVVVRNAPSPAATAALAVARLVADTLDVPAR